MRKATIAIGSLLALAVVLLMRWQAIGPARGYPPPEDGAVSRGVYRNEYFGLLYPLPPTWVEDLKGPPPSATGYYSLASLKPQDSLAATLLIAAQDNFFAERPVTTAEDFLERTKRQLDPALSAEPPVQVKIAGQSFARLDYAGAGLHHVLLATEIRCHP